LVASTFIQRAYDQLIQDLSLNDNPATIIVNGGGITSASDTHI
jgi:1-deoxy-D-xylulose-5-phosphate synthase